MHTHLSSSMYLSSLCYPSICLSIYHPSIYLPILREGKEHFSQPSCHYWGLKDSTILLTFFSAALGFYGGELIPCIFLGSALWVWAASVLLCRGPVCSCPLLCRFYPVSHWCIFGLSLLFEWCSFLFEFWHTPFVDMCINLWGLSRGSQVVNSCDRDPSPVSRDWQESKSVKEHSSCSTSSSTLAIVGPLSLALLLNAYCCLVMGLRIL